MAKLELQNITKRFGDITALDNVSFTIKDGEFFCLLGSSGAGKSTTIGIIAGIEKPENGNIFIDAKSILHDFPQNRNTATAFESYALYPHFTVYQNLVFPLEAPMRKKKYSKEERDKRVKDVATMLGIEELLLRYPRELSGGQKQRVALGRTLVRRPKAYLLDEPIAHLDAKLRHRMRAELKKIQQELGITTLYSTPDQLEALSMGDSIAVLNKGKIEQVGTGDELYYKPLNIYVAQFIGDPPMNMFQAEINGEYAVLENESVCRIPITKKDQSVLNKKSNGGREVCIGVRPRDIRVTAHNDEKAHVRGEVILLDTLGQVSIITIKTVVGQIKAKISSDHLPELHGPAGLEFVEDRLYFFDKNTTKRIG